MKELDVDLEEDEEAQEIMLVELYLISESLNFKILSSPNTIRAKVHQRLQVVLMMILN